MDNPGSAAAREGERATAAAKTKTCLMKGKSETKAKTEATAGGNQSIALRGGVRYSGQGQDQQGRRSTAMTANQNDQGGKMFVHFWEPTPSYLFEHHSTGLKFMCVEREPGNDPEKWERWDCYTYPVKADDAQVRKEAAAAGMEPSKYVDYLMETARELANKHRIKMGKRWG